MLCVWWTVRGVVYYELLPPNTTVTVSYYCSQLQLVKAELDSKRTKHGKVRLLHDNAIQHIVLSTKNKLKELAWEVLSHLPYSPDLALSNYHLFRSLHHFFKDRQYQNRDDVKTDLNFFSSLNQRTSIEKV